MKDIATLKKYILEAEDISATVKYFFDLIEEREGKLCNHTEVRLDNANSDPEFSLALKAAMHAVGNRLKKTMKIMNERYMKIERERFYHGYCILSGIPVPVLILYCSEYQVGITVVSKLDGNTNFIRFSLMQWDENCAIH